MFGSGSGSAAVLTSFAGGGDGAGGGGGNVGKDKYVGQGGGPGGGFWNTASGQTQWQVHGAGGGHLSPPLVAVFHLCIAFKYSKAFRLDALTAICAWLSNLARAEELGAVSHPAKTRTAMALDIIAKFSKSNQGFCSPGRLYSWLHCCH